MSRLTTLDPRTREVDLIFHPRKDQWDDHFALEGYFIHGITPVGTATEKLSKFNSDERVELRAEMQDAE